MRLCGFCASAYGTQRVFPRNEQFFIGIFILMEDKKKVFPSCLKTLQRKIQIGNRVCLAVPFCPVVCILRTVTQNGDCSSTPFPRYPAPLQTGHLLLLHPKIALIGALYTHPKKYVYAHLYIYVYSSLFFPTTWLDLLMFNSRSSPLLQQKSSSSELLHDPILHIYLSIFLHDYF